jgi:DNA-directed RNA polymerase specialized sigma24 family protein
MRKVAGDGNQRGAAADGNDGIVNRRLERWCAGDDRLIRAVLRWAHNDLAPRLWRRHGGSLSREEVDDIAAAAVERAWERRAAFTRQKGALKGWLWTIAARLALDEVGAWWHGRRDPALAASDDWERGLRDIRTSDDIEEITVATISETQSAAFRVISDHLSPKELAVLLADACSRGSVADSADLAQELGVSRSSVPVIRYRAKRRAAAALQRQGLAPKTKTVSPP